MAEPLSAANSEGGRVYETDCFKIECSRMTDTLVAAKHIVLKRSLGASQ